MNKTIKKLIITTSILLLVATNIAEAQRYISALGIRGGKNQFLNGASQIGLTYQQRFTKHSTIEVIGLYDLVSFSATGLLEFHTPIITKGFNYYIGFGAHLGHHQDTGVYPGIDAILGLEWKISGIPLVLSYDVKPAFHLNHNKAVQFNTGVSVRYVIITEKALKKKQREKEKMKRKEKRQDWWNRTFRKNQPEPEPEPKKKGLKDLFKKKEPEPEPERKGLRDLFKKKD